MQEDIPQPALEPYSPSAEVQIYLDPADPDAQTHGMVCEAVDMLSILTSKPTGDTYSYRLKDLETGDTFPLAFRH